MAYYKKIIDQEASLYKTTLRCPAQEICLMNPTFSRLVLLLAVVLGLSGCIAVPYDGPVQYRTVSTTMYPVVPATPVPVYVTPGPVYMAPPPVVIAPPIHFGFGLHYYGGPRRGPYYGHGRRW